MFEDFIDWCTAHGHDPDDPESRELHRKDRQHVADLLDFYRMNHKPAGPANELRSESGQGQENGGTP